MAAAGLVALSTAQSAPVAGQDAARRPFVDAAAVVDGLLVEMRYYGDNNFTGGRIDGYERPRCLLTRPAARALAAVANDLRPDDLVLKVLDCYRPTRAVAHFVRWARDPGELARKRDFYPYVDKRDLFRLGYIAARSGHSRGSTVDLTLARRADGKELDMGTGFDLFSSKSWPSDRSISEEAQRHRALLANMMRRRGFVPYDKEWWHFTLANEPFPHTYFDFAVR
jgi:D-alanyl-D-alanine dipeptidase